ncbi:hypothetical protein BJ138DRAFT_1144223 [Hygrophoropsis aurantiaca]|uniref:Uncharacterized protein n=1 Tax=Hygrophoropsis aurantiaca TaxID=72124 RepID=A0ACB8ALY2_9AGAM|nr:hypothetical protein BJ138DRAFT_1144223 [Hygrophoropsis aurantiaca]
MLLCRRLLPQVHLPNHVPIQFFTRRTSHNGLARVLQPENPNAIQSRVLSETNPARQYERPPHQDHILGQLLERVDKVSKNSKWAKKNRHRQKNPKDEAHSLDVYTTLRNQDRSLLTTLSSEILAKIAENAVQDGSATIVDNLAADVLEDFVGDISIRCKIAIQLLSVKPGQSCVLHKPYINALLNLIIESHYSSLLSLEVVSQLFTNITSNASLDSEDGKTLDILLPIFEASLRAIQLPQGSKSISYRPPAPMFIAFGLVDKLVDYGRNQRALALFRILVETNHIPAEALHEMNPPAAGSQNFATTIRFTLVRSCLHWNWHLHALTVVTSLTRDQSSLDEKTLGLCMDALYAVLEGASRAQLRHCCRLICHLSKAITDFSIPDRMVRLVYDRARVLKHGGPAETLFKHTQSWEVLEKIHYPLPRGPSLTWLMEYLTTTSRNMHLARMLAKQVVELSEPIPLQDRARFIALSANHGFALHARALWERYAVGKDRNVVVGNAGTMIRMVSLFSSLAARTNAKLKALSNRREEGTEEVYYLNHDVEKERKDDIINFAKRVVDDFRQCHDPLHEARHFQLTSLARGYFLLGRVTDGFEMFRIILRRREIPDMHDLNVALSAIAEYCPRTAAGKVDRMIAKGLSPDAVTFGTILHYAVAHGDMELVSSLLDRAHDLDRGDFTQKSLATVIRTGVRLEGETSQILKANLHRAWNVITSADQSNILCTPNMGKYCIFAALQVGEPAMAFKFWDFLVKQKSQWDDREQIFLRRLLAVSIRKHCRSGHIEQERGLTMLRRLGEDLEHELPTVPA